MRSLEGFPAEPAPEPSAPENAAEHFEAPPDPLVAAMADRDLSDESLAALDTLLATLGSNDPLRPAFEGLRDQMLARKNNAAAALLPIQLRRAGARPTPLSEEPS